jgi:hypothetical protein
VYRSCEGVWVVRCDAQSVAAQAVEGGCCAAPGVVCGTQVGAQNADEIMLLLSAGERMLNRATAQLRCSEAVHNVQCTEVIGVWVVRFDALLAAAQAVGGGRRAAPGVLCCL